MSAQTTVSHFGMSREEHERRLRTEPLVDLFKLQQLIWPDGVSQEPVSEQSTAQHHPDALDSIVPSDYIQNK